MCGRSTSTLTWAELKELYQISEQIAPTTNLEPQYNIAPTDEVDFVHFDPKVVGR